MASQIGSAITPGGHQAYSDMVNQEQFNRAQGLQQMNQMQQMGMQQQALDAEQAYRQQQLAMDQARLAQSGYQFERGMQDIAAGREHEMARDRFRNELELEQLTKAQEFANSQREASQKFSQQQAARIQQYDLEIENIRVQAENAREAGMLDVLSGLMAEERDLLRRKSKTSMALALKQAMEGQTREGVERIINGAEQNLSRTMNVEQQSQARARAFANQYAAMLDDESNKSNISAFERFYGEQIGGLDFLNPASPDFTSIRDAVNAGQAPGIEFLKLSPTSFGRLGAASWYKTPSALAGGGEMNAVEMTDVLKGRIANSTVRALEQMGIRDFDSARAADLVNKALSGSADKAEIARLAADAKVPVSTLKMLLASAAETFENRGEGSKYAQLVARRTQMQAEEPEQTLQSIGIKKAIEAFDIQRSLLRKAANVLPGMDLSEYEAGLEAVRAFKQTGQLSGLQEAMGIAGMGDQSGELMDLINRRSRGRQGLIEDMVGLGDLAEEEAMAERTSPLRMLAARRRGSRETGDMLARLIAERKAEAGD